MLGRFLLMVFIVSSSLLFAQEKGVKISVTGIKKIKGDLLVAFYNKESGFLKSDKAVYSQIVNVKSQTIEVLFKDIVKGEYAIAIIHDANSNGKLDTNFLGIPVEYIGTSNNVRNMFGPPSYKEAKFNYKGQFMVLKIELY